MNCEMSVNKHVMMSSSLCHPDNLLNGQHWTASAVHTRRNPPR